MNLELKRIADYFCGIAEEVGVTLDIKMQGSLQLAADPVLLRRAISNLVANAIQHSPRGGCVTILAHEQDGNQVVISVSNHGSGILPEHLPRIFDRFYRADNSRAGSRSSSGLGLAIVKSIVTLHGGDVRVESVPGGLTTFILVMPKGYAGESVDVAAPLIPAS